MDNKPQPVAMKLAEMLPASEWLGHETLACYARECVAELLTQHARITELESQLAQRFDAADMATAAAQGFRDGVASAALASTPAQPAPSAAVGQILEKINSLIASINEAHHAKDPLWRQGCFDAADSLYRQIKEMLAAAPGPADGESNELC